MENLASRKSELRNTRKPREKRTQNLATLWTAHLPDDKAKADFQQLLALSNGPVLKRLLDIVSHYKNQAGATALSKANYDSPSWAYLQADAVGFQRALTTVEALLKGIVKE